MRSFKGVGQYQEIKLFDWRKQNITHILNRLIRITKVGAILNYVDKTWDINISPFGYDESNYSQYVYGKTASEPVMATMPDGNVVPIDWEKYVISDTYPDLSSIQFTLTFPEQSNPDFFGKEDLRQRLLALSEDDLESLCISKLEDSPLVESFVHIKDKQKYECSIIVKTKELYNTPDVGFNLAPEEVFPNG